ncbi:MAG: tagaturonate reductase [Eubacteriales bacterium]
MYQDKPQKHIVERPSKVLQFGEGNFLRAFVDYIIDCSNNAGVFDGNITVVKPISYGSFERFTKQNNLYTVILRGIKNDETSVEKHIVTSITKTVDPFTQFDEYNKLMENPDFRFFVSNTTEAGIVYSDDDKFSDEIPNTFPAKVAKMLHQRYTIFNGDINKGFIFLPVELIEKNGDNLKKCVLQYCSLWNMDKDFVDWVENANIFCNTLVDRIVSGYPKAEEEQLWQEMGYKDELMVTGEPFGFWAIGSEKIEQVKKELHLESNVEIVMSEDIEPYKQRKVRILNGAHTSTVMGGYLCGKNIVAECMHDDDIRNYMLSCIYDEIIPNIDLDQKQLEDFAASVVSRFKNPFLNHKLLDICLNSTSKWRARVLPSFMDYYESEGKIPEKLTMSFAMYISFYKGLKKDDNGYYNFRDGERYRVLDDEYALEVYRENSNKSSQELIKTVMTDTKLWGADLTEFDGFYDEVCSHIEEIEKVGMKSTLAKLMKE